MLREQILQKAEIGFARLGIKALNIGGLVSDLHISKKTLYSYFSSKEELLTECLERYITRSKEQILQQAQGADTVLEAILIINRTALYQWFSLCPAFHEEIKYHARLQEMISRHYLTFIRTEYLKYFICADQDGLFVERHNPLLTLDFFEGRISLCSEWSLPPSKEQIENYGITIFTYLSGICTDKGRRQLETFQPDIFTSYQNI